MFHGINQKHSDEIWKFNKQQENLFIMKTNKTYPENEKTTIQQNK